MEPDLTSAIREDPPDRLPTPNPINNPLCYSTIHEKKNRKLSNSPPKPKISNLLKNKYHSLRTT